MLGATGLVIPLPVSTGRSTVLPPSQQWSTPGHTTPAIRPFGRLYPDGRKPICPLFQIGSRYQRFLPDLANWNFAAGNQFIEFCAPNRCNPTALGNGVEQLIHESLAIVGRAVQRG
jgi:hypothetical protein